MPETSGYRDVLEECLGRKVLRGNYFNSCDIMVNELGVFSFLEAESGDSPSQVRSALKAVMKNYQTLIKDIEITPEPKNHNLGIVFKVSEGNEIVLIHGLRTAYDAVKNEAEEAKAVLENAKKNL